MGPHILTFTPLCPGPFNIDRWPIMFPPSSFSQVKSCLINKDGLMKNTYSWYWSLTKSEFRYTCFIPNLFFWRMQSVVEILTMFIPLNIFWCLITRRWISRGQITLLAITIFTISLSCSSENRLCSSKQTQIHDPGNQVSTVYYNYSTTTRTLQTWHKI